VIDLLAHKPAEKIWRIFGEISKDFMWGPLLTSAAHGDKEDGPLRGISAVSDFSLSRHLTQQFSVFEIEPVAGLGLGQDDRDLRSPGIVKKKRTEITIEIDEVVFVRGFSKLSGRAWCVGCANEVFMVTPAQAAVIAQVSVRTVNRWVEEGRIHFTETQDGLLFACLNSLRML
jgi:hypothetical protein